jgi:hypothetical protein
VAGFLRGLFFDLKMEAISSFETSAAFQQTTQHCIPEDRILHNRRCEKSKSYITTEWINETRGQIKSFIETVYKGVPSVPHTVPGHCVFRGGPGSSPGLVCGILWWTKVALEQFSPRTSVSPAIYIPSASPQSSSLSPEAGTIGQEWPQCQ